ncbi:porin [Thiomicrorhabdus indica]|uniref:porin n=1 Tax=Thiomicrorhabdus indica TaxID=2267253 RepID=UPI002AA9270F|nr:porin [Thiomicrorhabdus indica]
MKKRFNLSLIVPVSLSAVFMASNAMAANWLMLQGTEPEHQAPATKLWGFVQAEYIKTDDTKLPNGNSAAFNQIAPQLDTADSFNVKRARIGVRGNNLLLDSKVNYFLLAEFGNNGLTTGGNASRGQLTDASVTLNHIPGARVRVGLFKTPGSEEGMQAVAVANYINFSNVTDRIVNERYFENSVGNTGRSAPAGAFRDTGVQVFDTFNYGDWSHTYALMYGNGYGVEMSDNDSHKDVYAYLSTEKHFSKNRGGRSDSMKFYVWHQNGKRTLNDVGTVDRKRTGLGATYFDGTFRLGAEYVTADGMIYGGTSGAGVPDDGATFSVLPDEKAKGYYLDLGYRVIPSLELNVRYDMLDSATETASLHREFQTTTLGMQYFVNKKTTLRLNYELRDIDAPDLPSTAPVHKVLESIDDRISAQVSVHF